jgi:hypothetical protein
VQIPIATFPEFESSEIMFLADRVFAGSTGYLPPETPITILAQGAGTGLGL